MAALQNFIDNSLPTIKAAFLNQVDVFVNTLFNGATTPAQARTALGLTLVPVAECYLSLSGGNLLLAPYNGNTVFINGTYYTLPSAGITLAPSGATPSTLYYIYAFFNGTSLALEYSTTVYTLNTTYGQLQKTGDATRILVGMAYAIAGPSWVDTATNRGVLSWFNQKKKSAVAALSSSQAVPPSTYAIIGSGAGLTVQYLTWANTEVSFLISGSSALAAGAFGSVGTSVDSSLTPVDAVSIVQNGSGATVNLPFTIPYTSSSLSEGYHGHQLIAFGGGTSVQINGGASPGANAAGRTVISGTIWG